jgi:hypothetical protein
MKEYVTEEPKKATVWVDNNGHYCKTKEQALRSNFEIELLKVCEAIVYSENGCYKGATELSRVLILMAEKRPDLLRRLLD